MCLLDMVEASDLDAELSRRKEMKIQVPMELYIKLHQHKIINGEYLSDVVTEAISTYIDEELSTGDEGEPEGPAEGTDPREDP